MSSTLSNPLLQYDFKFQSASDPIVNIPNSAYNITPNPWQIKLDDAKFGQVFQCENAGVANLEVPAGWSSNLPTSDFTFTAWVKISSEGGDKTIFSLSSNNSGTVMLCVVGNSLSLNSGPPGSTPGNGAPIGGPPNQSGYQLINLPYTQSQVQDQWVYLAVSFSANNPAELFLNAAGAWSSQKAAHPLGFDPSSTLCVGQPNATSSGTRLGDIAWFSVYNQAANAQAQLETDMNTRQKITAGTISSDLPAAVLQYDFKYKKVEDPIVNIPNPAYNMTPDPWKIVQDDPKFGQVFQCTNAVSANLQIPTAWNASELVPECTITAWVKLSSLSTQNTILNLDYTMPHSPALSLTLCNTSNSFVLNSGPQGQQFQLLTLSFDPTEVQGEWVYLALSINSSKPKPTTLYMYAGANWTSAKTPHAWGLTQATLGSIYIGQSSPINEGAGMGDIAWFSVYQKAVSGSIELMADMMSRKKFTQAVAPTKLTAPLLQYDFKCETPYGPIVNLTNPEYNITPGPWKICPDDSKFGQVFQCSNTGVANLPVPHNFSVNSFYPECTISAWVKIDVNNGSQTVFSFAIPGKTYVLYNSSTDWVLSIGNPSRNPGTDDIPIVSLPFETSQVQNQWVYLAVSFNQANDVTLFMNAGDNWTTKSSGPPPPHFPYGLSSTGMGPLLIGQSNTGYQGAGMGYIAWFAVYPDAASESTQLETDMNTRQKYAPAPPSYPDKLIDFDFSSISGNTLTNPSYTNLNSSLGSGVNSGADSANVFGNVLHFNGGTNPGVTIPPLKTYFSYPLFSIHNGMSLTAWVYLESASSNVDGVFLIRGQNQPGLTLGVNNSDWMLNDFVFTHSGIQNQWAFVAFVISSSPTAGAATVTYYQYTDKAGWISPQTKTGTLKLDEYCGSHKSYIGSFIPFIPAPPAPTPPAIPGFTGQLAKFSLNLNQLTQAEVEAEMPHEHSAMDLSVIYDFMGISGTTLPSKGNARFDGTLSAGIKAPVTDAELGKCLSLGAGDEISIPGLGAYGISDFSKAFSLTAWVKLSKLSSTAATILALGSNQEGDNLTFGYTTAGWQLSYGGQTVDFAFDQNEVENQWVFVALTKGQQGSLTCEHYIGGQKTNNTGSGPASLPTGVGLVNNSIGSTTNGMVGEVAWFALYNQELSQEQIMSDMTAKGIVIMPEPVLEFNFKSTSNSTIPNLSNTTYKATYGAGCSPFNDPQFGKTLSFTKAATATLSPALTGVGADDLSKGLTIGCWVNLGSANISGTSKLFSIGSLVEVAYDSSSSWTFNSGSGTPLTSPQSTSPVGSWNYLAASLDSSGNATISVFDGETWSHKSGQLSGVNLSGINSQTIYIGASSGASNGFAGDIAWLSVYKGVLSQKYFEEDMLLGKLQSNTSYRKNIPVDFKLTSFENGENVPVIFIEQKGQGKDVNLALTNVSTQKITIPSGTSSVSASYAQFQIRFKPGVLSAGFLGKSKALKNTNANHDDYWTDGRWQIAVYTDPLTNEGLLNIVNSGSSLPWTPKEVLTVKIGPMNADPLGGVRGTTTMLHYMGLSMGTNPVSGFRVQSLGIVSHLGQKNIPMHVGILGADRVLNNGIEDDLIIRIENTAAHTAIPLTSTTEDAKAKFVIGFEIQPENAVMDWALISYKANLSTKLHWNILGVIKTDAAQGATTIELDQPLTHNLSTSSPNLVISDGVGVPTPVTLADDATIGQKSITVDALTSQASAGAVLSMASSQADWSIGNNGSIPSETSGSFSWEVDYNGSGELAAGDSIDFLIKDIICDLPVGQAVISFQYSNLGGYWGGEFTIVVEKSAISMNQSTVGIGLTSDQLATKTQLQVPYVPNSGHVGLLLGSDSKNDNGGQTSAITVLNTEDDGAAFTLIDSAGNTKLQIGNKGNLTINASKTDTAVNPLNVTDNSGNSTLEVLNNGQTNISDLWSPSITVQGTHGATAINVSPGNIVADYISIGQIDITGTATSNVGAIKATEVTISGTSQSSLGSIGATDIGVSGSLSAGYPAKGDYKFVIADSWPTTLVAAAFSIAVPNSKLATGPALKIANQEYAHDMFTIYSNGVLRSRVDTGLGAFSHAICVNFDGWLGVGTIAPVAPVDIEVYSPSPGTGYGLLGGTNEGTQNYNQALYTSKGSVAALSYLTISDTRIKDIEGESDSLKALQLLNQVAIKEYRYKDTHMHGNGIRKGVIAQELAQIMPDLVNKSADFIPDIYANATTVKEDLVAQELELTMAKPHGLKVGDKVKIAVGINLHRLEVTQVSSQTTFIVGDWEEKNTDTAFVYGKMVDDFHQVDYATLNVMGISAIQQLSKEVDTLKAENQELKAANEALQEKFDTEIAALKAAIAKLSS